MQTKKADYSPRTVLHPPLPAPSESELWKFDQGLNLNSACLCLHFNGSLRDEGTG